MRNTKIVCTLGPASNNLETVCALLDAGISVASVEYRFIPEATADGVVPPVKGPLHDAAEMESAFERGLRRRDVARRGGGLQVEAFGTQQQPERMEHIRLVVGDEDARSWLGHRLCGIVASVAARPEPT